MLITNFNTTNVEHQIVLQVQTHSNRMAEALRRDLIEVLEDWNVRYDMAENHLVTGGPFLGDMEEKQSINEDRLK